MNLEARKLDVISFLISLKDEVMLNKIEKVINTNNDLNSSYPFSKDELVNRALKSEDDLANGRVISQGEVERISEKW